MAAARGATLAAAMRMIDRIHRHAAIVRLPALPAIAAGLADRDVHVVGVRNRADGGEAASMHEPLLAGIEPNDAIAAVAADDLRIVAGGAGELAALADL